ncbi:MAG: DUF732 domain-containing protein [Pseudonocardiaceae bacterium]
MTAPVTADPAPDYLARLNTAGIDYDAPTMIDAAKLVCDDLNQGATVASTVAQVVVRLPSYGTAASFQAGAIIGAAAATYCPQYHELVQAYGNGA